MEFPGYVAVDAKKTFVWVSEKIGEIINYRREQERECIEKFNFNYQRFWYRFWILGLRWAFNPVSIENFEDKDILDLLDYKSSNLQYTRFKRLQGISKLCINGLAETPVEKVLLTEDHFDCIMNWNYPYEN